MLIHMSSVQLNIRTSHTLLHELDTVVGRGLFRSRTEAVNEAIRLLIRRYRVMKIAETIDGIAGENLGDSGLSEVLAAAREEEDA